MCFLYIPKKGAILAFCPFILLANPFFLGEILLANFDYGLLQHREKRTFSIALCVEFYNRMDFFQIRKIYRKKKRQKGYFCNLTLKKGEKDHIAIFGFVKKF